jgi:hypothetical protein
MTYGEQKNYWHNEQEERALFSSTHDVFSIQDWKLQKKR